MAFTWDPIDNAIRKGIVRSIKVTLDNDCHRATAILVFAGVDAMANLSRPEGKAKVEPDDFIAWANKYIKISGKKKVTGEELYGARCGMLHTYGIESTRTKQGIRKIVYAYDEKHIPAKYSVSVSSPQIVVISIEVLAGAFLRGVERFLKDLHREMADNPQREKTIENRLGKLVLSVPIPELRRKMGI